MRHGVLNKVLALMVCGAVGVLLAPGCDALGLSSGEGGGGAGGGGGGLDTLASADPTQVELAEMQAGYTAYSIQGMIEQNVADPDNVDDATLQQMAAQYAPDAAASAQQWAQGLDASAIPAWMPDWKRQGECRSKYGCEFVETCPFSSGPSSCFLTNCGDGKCPSCPDLFGISSALVTGWCAHVCIRDGTADVAGYAAVIHFRGGGRWRYCYEAANGN